jgi:hypothetical protein
MSLSDYIDEFKDCLQTFDDYGLSTRIDFSAEIRPGSQAFLRARIQFIDTSELHIREFLLEQGTIQHLSYAYQYQRQDGTLIFRYDNAKHRPDLGFERHKHQPDGSIIPANLPDIEFLIIEIVDHISK